MSVNDPTAGPCTGDTLQIKDVEAFHRTLLEHLESSNEITVDVSRLTTIDGAGVQLLLAFDRSRAAQGRAVRWVGDSPALARALQLLGCSLTGMGRTAHG